MSENHKARNYTIAGAVIFFTIFWTVLLFIYSPKEIVEAVGVTNGYVLTFLVAVVGSLSSVTTFSIYPMIVTFALGELNPVLLGLIAGVGLSIGDLIFFYFGLKIRTIVKGRFKEALKNFFDWLVKRPQWQVYLLVYLYIAFTPFPNDLLTGTLAVSGYPFKKIVIPLCLGDMTFPLLAIFLAREGVKIF